MPDVMKLDNLRWTLRITLMFSIGVVPAILLLLIILVLMPLMGIIAEFVYWFALMVFLALLGIVGLWGATFRDGKERGLPNGIAIVLVLFGLLAALPYLYALAPDAVEDGGFFLLLTSLLLGPVACAVYFLVEQFILMLRGRSGASNSSLESDAAKPRASG
jgi:hypothetical protein